MCFLWQFAYYSGIAATALGALLCLLALSVRAFEKLAPGRFLLGFPPTLVRGGLLVLGSGMSACGIAALVIVLTWG